MHPTKQLRKEDKADDSTWISPALQQNTNLWLSGSIYVILFYISSEAKTSKPNKIILLFTWEMKGNNLKPIHNYSLLSPERWNAIISFKQKQMNKAVI